MHQSQVEYQSRYSGVTIKQGQSESSGLKRRSDRELPT